MRWEQVGDGGSRWLQEARLSERRLSALVLFEAG